MQRVYAMPFGAEVCPDGQVRFRLWAPQARSVHLCLESPESLTLLPMKKSGSWYEIHGTGASGVIVSLPVRR